MALFPRGPQSGGGGFRSGLSRLLSLSGFLLQLLQSSGNSMTELLVATVPGHISVARIFAAEMHSVVTLNGE